MKALFLAVQEIYTLLESCSWEKKYAYFGFACEQLGHSQIKQMFPLFQGK